MQTRKNVGKGRKKTIAPLLLLYCLSFFLLSACSESNAFKTNWGIDFPDSYFSGRKCIVDMGIDYICVIECQDISKEEIEQYSFMPVDQSARMAFKEIEDIVNARNKRTVDEHGESVSNISMLIEIDERWDELSYYMVRKTEVDYCILLYDSTSNVLYICECS